MARGRILIIEIEGLASRFDFSIWFNHRSFLIGCVRHAPPSSWPFGISLRQAYAAAVILSLFTKPLSSLPNLLHFLSLKFR
ncbi:hypothetical protein L1887_01712 [Cichorium endivia]|nr:hypothetical protein L1887_01712 [Cichorium endivia]